MPAASHRLAVAVLISGGGTTLRNLLDYVARGDLNIEIRLVAASRADAAGLRFAEAAQIPTIILPAKPGSSPESLGRAVFEACREQGVELVIMAGFLKRIVIPPDFENRVMNIHPGLIPAFCGQGYYGLRVHQAVLDYGAKLSGCTVHFVDQQYDHGPIILQRALEVRDDDTAESLQQRVFQLECQAYPEAIRLFAEGRLHVDGRRVSRK